MAYSKDRLSRGAAIFNRTLSLFILCVFSLFACKRSETPSPPETPVPKTRAMLKISDGVKIAIYSYSLKTAPPSSDQCPAKQCHPTMRI